MNICAIDAQWSGHSRVSIHIYIFLYIFTFPKDFWGLSRPATMENHDKSPVLRRWTQWAPSGSHAPRTSFQQIPPWVFSTPRWIWDPDVYFETQICLKLLQVLEVVWMQHSAKSNHFVIAQGTWKQVLYLDIQVNDIQIWKKKPLGIWHDFLQLRSRVCLSSYRVKGFTLLSSMGFRFLPLKCQPEQEIYRHKVKFCYLISSMLRCKLKFANHCR